MPRDIRSYFAPVATYKKKSIEPVVPKSKKRHVISSDDETEEKPISPTKCSEIAQTLKKVSASSDSKDVMFTKDDKKDLKESKRSHFESVTHRKNSNKHVSPKPKKRHLISSDDEDEEKPKLFAKRSKIVQKANKVSALSDSEDEMIVDDKKDSKQSKASKENVNKKLCKEIAFSELFSKKPVTRVEETKVSRKLHKMESEFHDDDAFDTVLEQLDSSQSTTMQDAMKDADSKNKKHDVNLKYFYNDTNKKNEIEAKEVKKSPCKNNNATKITCSPTKQSLQKEKRNSFSSNEDSSTSDKYNTPKKRNFNNLKDVATLNKDEDTKEQLGRKKAKTVDLFEERIEKKKERAAMYEKYLQRGGARNPGSKEIPSGAKNCLAGVTFVLTGVLDSLERDEAEDLIRQYGGRTVNTVSRKVNYIIVGDEAGPSKLIKASSLGVKQISEDDLLQMIRTRPEGRAEDIKSIKARVKSKKSNILSESDKSPSPKKAKAPLSSSKNVKTPPRSPVKAKMSSPIKQASDTSSASKSQEISVGMQPLVEKYRPKTLKKIIGQQGDKSCAHNLYVWLRDWHKNRQDQKVKNANKQTHGQSFKAALLSGPPGVGKTTTVQVVCKELGYDLVEFNASDTRNKTLLKEEVSGLLSNTTIKDYITGAKQKTTSKHVLLMDEVDGMAGNEDRGGLQELVGLIKNTEVPIVCICNDRYNTKVKTISTHSYDLKFPKLRVEQIRSSILSLCYQENIKISKEDLDRLIESTNYDIRQVINHLEFLNGQTVQVEATKKKHSNKNFKLGPFDVAKMVFNAEQQKSTSLNDKIDLYFHDYNIAPLFVQENYLGVRLSQVSPQQRLNKIARAADSISQGDLIEKMMRSNMMWSLLPIHACFSFVLPSSEMSGSLDTMVRFPSWFGRNSKAMRFNRLMQELTTHTRLVTGANKDALNLDYLVHIRNAVIKPLIDSGVDGIEAAINVMGKYHLTREDLDSIIEISLWPGVRDPTSNLDSKVKAAFTRAYQKNPPMLPYTINSNVTARKRSAQDDDFMEEEDDEEENDNIDSDKMIKAKKPTAASTSKASKAAASTKRSGEPAKKRAKGRGKAK